MCKVGGPAVSYRRSKRLHSTPSEAPPPQSAEEVRRWLLGLQALTAQRKAPRAAPEPATARIPLPWPKELLVWGQHAATSRGRGVLDAAGLFAAKVLSPLQFSGADGLDMAAVSFSTMHCAGLGDDGGVLTWGVSSGCGELGHSSQEGVLGSPRRVDALADVHVTQVACGAARTAAVSADGNLLLMGCVPAHVRLGVSLRRAF